MTVCPGCGHRAVVDGRCAECGIILSGCCGLPYDADGYCTGCGLDETGADRNDIIND